MQAKINKYHFTLDKIEEEMTPVPSNSEYSKKRTSSRDDKISNSSGNNSCQKQKKPKKFFPNNGIGGSKNYSNKYPEILEDVNENKSSILTGR